MLPQHVPAGAFQSGHPRGPQPPPTLYSHLVNHQCWHRKDPELDFPCSTYRNLIYTLTWGCFMVGLRCVMLHYKKSPILMFVLGIKDKGTGGGLWRSQGLFLCFMELCIHGSYLAEGPKGWRPCQGKVDRPTKMFGCLMN